jgi:hypothetical protein
VNISGVGPFNVDFNGDGLQDFQVSISLPQLCGLVSGSINNWAQLGGPNAPIRRVYRADTNPINLRLNDTILLNCGFFISDNQGNILLNPSSPPRIDSDDIPVFSDEEAVNQIINNVGTIGYTNFGIAFRAGLTDFTRVVVNSQVFTNFESGTLFVGFYEDYPQPIQTDFAGNLCLYITQGLNFGEPVGFLSGREFAVSQSYQPPTFGEFNGFVPGGVNLDSNCLRIFDLGTPIPVPAAFPPGN